MAKFLIVSEAEAECVIWTSKKIISIEPDVGCPRYNFNKAVEKYIIIQLVKPGLVDITIKWIQKPSLMTLFQTGGVMQKIQLSQFVLIKYFFYWGMVDEPKGKIVKSADDIKLGGGS